MSIYGWALSVWTILSVVSWPYVARAGHPSISHATAWLVFVATFTALAPVLFGLLTAIALDAHRDALLTQPPAMVALLGLTFAPGLLLGRWLISRPLRRMPLPGE